MTASFLPPFDSRPSLGRASKLVGARGANDDEFDSGTISASWTEVVDASSPGTYVARYDSMYYRQTSTSNASSKERHALVRTPSSISTGDFIETQVLLFPHTDYTAAGLVFADSTTYGSGNLVNLLYYAPVGASPFIRGEHAATWGASPTEGSFINQSSASGLQGMYLRLKYESANTWGTYYSWDGFEWVTIQSNLSKTLTPTVCGLVVFYHTPAGNPPQAWIRWHYFRYSPANE